jgi:uncharacterized protein (TIGR00255 family)
MIKSMTGFGRGELNTEIGRLTVEVKSVNNRAFSAIVKLPETLSSLENQVSSYIGSRISRGQINVSVTLIRDESRAGRKVTVDQELAREYLRQLAAMKEYLSVDEPIGLDTVISLPGVINVEEPEEDVDGIWPSLNRVLAMAVDQLIETRGTEGAVILEDLSHRLETMSKLTERINARAPEVVEDYRQRLQNSIGELLQGQIPTDESRIAMEVAIMAKRCDITEEIVRLRSHIGQVKESMKDAEGPVGRHLDFILQEINREVNTIASKANDAQIAADCIRFKDETEKMREQAQNIE